MPIERFVPYPQRRKEPRFRCHILRPSLETAQFDNAGVIIVIIIVFVMTCVSIPLPPFPFQNFLPAPFVDGIVYLQKRRNRFLLDVIPSFLPHRVEYLLFARIDPSFVAAASVVIAAVIVQPNLVRRQLLLLFVAAAAATRNRRIRSMRRKRESLSGLRRLRVPRSFFQGRRNSMLRVVVVAAAAAACNSSSSRAIANRSAVATTITAAAAAAKQIPQRTRFMIDRTLSAAAFGNASAALIIYGTTAAIAAAGTRARGVIVGASDCVGHNSRGLYVLSLSM